MEWQRWYRHILCRVTAYSNNRIKKRSDTKQRFLDYILSCIEPMSNIIKKICDYIENRHEHNSVEQKMYTNTTASVVKQIMSQS